MTRETNYFFLENNMMQSDAYLDMWKPGFKNIHRYKKGSLTKTLPETGTNVLQTSWSRVKTERPFIKQNDRL